MLKNVFAATLMTVSLAMAVVAEPVEKLPNTEPAAPAVTTVTTVTPATQSPAQPEPKKDEKAQDKAPVQTQKPAPSKKPIELKFRDF